MANSHETTSEPDTDNQDIPKPKTHRRVDLTIDAAIFTLTLAHYATGHFPPLQSVVNSALALVSAIQVMILDILLALE
jgi:hypothetical protein